MQVRTLLHRIGEGVLTGDGGVTVNSITHDSRKVSPGFVFAALRGEHAHGLDYLKEAVAAGAAAILTDRPARKTVDLPWITVKNPRSSMARAAWVLAGNPQRKLQLFAVTGTNGKSTTAHLISGLMQSARKPAAFIGTLGARLDRVAGLEFDVAVWTNLSRDHLDYHHDMEAYFESKRRLFTDHLAPDGRRVLPVDDPWGARLLDEPRAGDVSWGLDRGAVCAKNIVSDLDGSRFDLNLPDQEISVYLPLVGVHNLRNALAAAAAAHAAGLSASAIRRGLERARPLAGRMERIETQHPFPVFVDYAHTPDGLRAVLQALRKITDRRLIVVFGAGGDRDSGKRGPMGFAVGESADISIVTSDNPRTEDPESIAAAVAEGVRAAGAEPLVVLDRCEAIARAVEIADSRSLILVAGKGHEAFQTIGEVRIPFSDQEVLRSEAGREQCA